jgi:hypothetical protein
MEWFWGFFGGVLGFPGRGWCRWLYCLTLRYDRVLVREAEKPRRLQYGIRPGTGGR